MRVDSFLQARLRIHRRSEAIGVGEQRIDQPQHERRRRIRPAGEVHGADHGFEAVGQDRRLLPSTGQLLAAAEAQVGAEVDHAGDFGERDGRHQAGPALRKVALVEVGVLAVEHHRHGLPENRVAEELEALVVGDRAVLVGVRPVGQRQLEKLGIN